ncbi:MAG TPA: hypothetical protein VMB02_04725 [Candidatus Aquilonibacter sp.]|nr:hypothetical protein [Candidatus Aquilonibacter sp.]
MKYLATVCGAVFAILCTAGAASAQSPADSSANSANPTLPTPPAFLAQLDPPLALPSFTILASPAMPAFAWQKDAPAAGSGAESRPQGVYGVFPGYPYEIYGGYTFIRFYIIPGVAENTNGVNFSAAYFFHGSLAADGEGVFTFGSYSGQSSQFYLGMGGVRYRHTINRADLWVHGLFGYAHFSPLTAYGDEGAIGYEVGGGMDLNPRKLPFSWRLQADMVGTHFFGTYQYSPKISFGIVYKD